MGLKVSHLLRCPISVPKARHRAALSFHDKYRDFFFPHSFTLEWNKTPLKCLVKALRKRGKGRKILFSSPPSPRTDPLIAVGPGDKGINLGSFAQADPERSLSLSFCGFSCSLIIPKHRASSLFFSPFFFFFLQQFYTKNHAMITSMEKHTSVKSQLWQVNIFQQKHFSSESSQPASTSRFQ